MSTGKLVKVLNDCKIWSKAVAIPDTTCIVSIDQGYGIEAWYPDRSHIETDVLTKIIEQNETPTHLEDAIIIPSANIALRLTNVSDSQNDPYKSEIVGLYVVDINQVIAISLDKNIRIWEIDSGQAKHSFYANLKHVGHTFLKDNLLFCYERNLSENIEVWNLITEKAMILREPSRVTSAITLLDGTRLVSASVDVNTEEKFIDIWNITTGTIEHTQPWREDFILSMITLDLHQVLSVDETGTLRILNPYTCITERTFSGHETRVNAIEIVDKQRFVTASSDKTLRLWNRQTGEVLRVFEGHKQSVNAVAIVDECYIVSGSSDYSLKVWSLKTGSEIASIVLDGAVQCVAVERQGDRTLVVAGDATGALYCLELVEPKN